MSVHVLRAGMLTTVQDCGRPGARAHGVVQGGAMDAVAARVANILAGNDACAAVLECTLTGPSMRMERDCIVTVTGDAPNVTLDDAPMAAWRAFDAPAESVLTVHDSGRGCRAYIAFGGGIDVPRVIGSRGTDLTACIGGIGGRALAVGDTIPLGAAVRHTAGAEAGRTIRPGYDDAPVLRVLPGADPGTDAARDVLLSSTFTLTAESNRMGCRLDGPTLPVSGREMISSPVAPGTIQLPPSGQPIVLMADGQTIGGYPRIAHVITADMPLLAQVRPGRTVRFVATDLATAHAALAERERDLRMLEDAMRLHGGAR